MNRGNRRVSLRTARRAVMVLAATVLLMCSCATGAPHPLPGASTAPSLTFADAVGPLFDHGTSNPHGCTASVISSRSGDVAMTAAHCLTGTAAGTVFVPGYRNGREPFGAWSVTGAYAPSGWVHGLDTDDDVAFLVLAPHRLGGVVTTVQQQAGAFRLGPAATPGVPVTVVAYDAGIDDLPISCATTIRETDTDPTFDCHGFVAGSSGAPWLSHGSDGFDVVGIIGGRRQGGCEEQTSFSPTFGADVASTLAAADRDAGSDLLPAPPDDGC